MSILENKVQIIPVMKHHLTKKDSIDKVKSVVREIIKTHKGATIYYRVNCNDGLASAYLMRECATALTGVVPRTVRVQHGTKFEMFDDSSLVIFVDFCPTIIDCAAFINSGVALLVIDHHKLGSHNVTNFLNDKIKTMTAPALFIFSEDTSASSAELAYLFTDNEVHTDTIEAIGRYDRLDKSHAWHQSQALASLINSRMPTIPIDSRIDKMGEFLTRPPSVTFGMALKFHAHHRSVIVSLAANAFNTGDVFYNDNGDRRAIIFTCDKIHVNDICDQLLESDKNLQVVCAICTNTGKVEMIFRSSKDRIGYQAIDFALALGGDGNPQAAEVICTYSQIDGMINKVKSKL